MENPFTIEWHNWHLAFYKSERFLTGWFNDKKGEYEIHNITYSLCPIDGHKKWVNERELQKKKKAKLIISQNTVNLTQFSCRAECVHYIACYGGLLDAVIEVIALCRNYL